MAIPTQQPETKKPQPKPPSHPNPNTNPFTFWFYFTISVSLLTLTSVTLSKFSTHQDPKAWFLTLPLNLRHHYSNGTIIKVQPTPHSNPFNLFTIQSGPLDSPHNILIIHGVASSSYLFNKVVNILGSLGVRAVAIDLPGSGFSDKFESVVEERVVSGFGRVLEVYNEIKEKGVFWGFDQLVEQGYVNYDYPENEVRVSKVESLKAIEVGPEEVGRVLGQVIETMGLGHVHLVFHDSAFNLAANWVAENVGVVASVTVIDGAPNETAFPLWALEMPVVREVVASFGFVFERVVRSCCLKSGGESESHRLLLTGMDGIKSVVAMGNRMNSSFDIGDWGKLSGVKNLPMQVIWSSGSSDEWIEKGRQVANALPQAEFIMHSSGCWPQDDTADELAKSILRFLSRLPKPVKVAKKRASVPVPEHIREMLDEATTNVHHHGFGGHDHSHGHGQNVGYPSGYGLESEF